MMRVIYFIIFHFLLTGCSPKIGQDFNADNCQLIKSILDAEIPYKILGLDKASEVYPYIRIIDMTGSFKDCSSFYRRESPPLLISYFVEQHLKVSLNTGHYRDVVVLDIKQNANNIKVILSAAAFMTSNNVNTVYQIDLEFQENKEGYYELIDQKAIEWNDSPPPVSYDEIKD